MNLQTIKSVVRNAFNARFGAGAFENKIGSRHDGQLPLAECAALALAAQNPQPVANTPATTSNAPTPAPEAAAPKALFDRIDSLMGELESAKSTIASLQAAKADIEAQFAVAKTKIATFDNQLETKAAFEAAKIVASAGLPRPVKLTPSAADAPASTDELLNKFNSLRDPRARAEFFKAHRDQLVSQ